MKLLMILMLILAFAGPTMAQDEPPTLDTPNGVVTALLLVISGLIALAALLGAKLGDSTPMRVVLEIAANLAAKTPSPADDAQLRAIIRQAGYDVVEEAGQLRLTPLSPAPLTKIEDEAAD
jgi:hypothetical protein